MAHKIRLDEVRAAAKKAYAEKRLTAQHPVRERRVCVYVDGDCGCVIGVALPRELTVTFDEETNRCALNALLQRGIVEVEQGEFADLCALQDAHDNWAQSGFYNHDEAMISAAETVFLNELNQVEDVT